MAFARPRTVVVPTARRLVPDAIIRWRPLRTQDDGLYACGCLYAVADANTHELLYIGKADRATVAERIRCRSKEGLWDYLARQRIRQCIVLLGTVRLAPGKRLSSELLADIESLLIQREQVCGNVQSKRSRTIRFGMLVRCAGSWPGRVEFYKDR